MRKLSRGTWIALAAVVAIPATVGIAKTVEHHRWHNMSPETRARLDDGRLAMAKTALKLTAEQEKLWSPLEAQVRDAFKARDAKRAEWDKKRAERKADRDKGGNKDRDDGKRSDLAERFDKMSANMTERAERMKAFAGTFKPLYASLSDEQKDVLRPLMRDLAPGFGHRKHHGPRWAFGGWGPHGGGHGKGEHHGHGGAMMDDDGPRGPDGSPEGMGGPADRGQPPGGVDAKQPEKL